MAVAKKGLINSVPKSGTNLLHSVLERLPGLRFQKLTLNRNFRWHPLNLLLPGWGGSCLVGVSQPQRVKLDAMGWQLRRLAAGRFTAAHLPYDAAVGRIMAERGIRVIFPVRDPRDVVVSTVFHVLSRPRHFLHSTYLRLPDEPARMAVAMLGLPDAPAGAVCGIAEQIAMTVGVDLRPVGPAGALRRSDRAARRQPRPQVAAHAHVGLHPAVAVALEAKGMVGPDRTRSSTLVRKAICSSRPSPSTAISTARRARPRP